MNIYDLGQILLFLAAIAVGTPLIGRFLANVFRGERHVLSPVLGGLERVIYRVCGIDASRDMDWKAYTYALLAFNAVGMGLLFLMQLFQGVLPMNPERLTGISWDLAFNTAVSFVTNTNWQSYAGETTMSPLLQMTGLTVQNFVSAATGIAVMIAMVRGFIGRETSAIGNFWVDLVRGTVYVLVPASLVFAVVLSGEGVVQTFRASTHVTTVEGAPQVLAMGPAASQVAIKQLGTNGGGYFNTNSAHPFENPTPLTNALELLAIVLLPAALVYAYGRMVGSTRQGWTLWAAMMALFLVLLAGSLWSEYHGNPLLHNAGIMEGKETRIGVANSVTWSVATTCASNGSVNAMHDSMSPLSGMIAMLNIMLGEIVFGGVGAGMYGMLVFVILTVFIAGLMVGRTPEYLGKKIEAFDVKMAALAVLAPSAVILLFSAIAVSAPAGLAGISNGGPHGFSQILYAFTSAAGNNGSAFAGLNANTPFYNVLLGIGMMIGRFGVIVPMLAVAGSMARKKITPVSAGTFPTDKPLFVVLLIGVIMIVGALTFFPALSLGPIVEHLLMVQGHGF